MLPCVAIERATIAPTPEAIRQRLGADSRDHALDRAALAALHDRHKKRIEVRAARRRWARLLARALGSRFVDRDDLFVDHTLLVTSARLIAHALLDLDLASLDAAALGSGEALAARAIHGAVDDAIDDDCFGWLAAVPGGGRLLRSLGRRLDRFDWGAVQHDALKVLYESSIPAPTRKSLGEFYTPDWLARQIVEHAAGEPLGCRLLDPSCGSGTFLFHAARRYLDAASGLPAGEALDGLARSVAGLDLHPVAVALARVTYLLAIGKQRLAQPRGALVIPVALGDAMRWGPDDAPGAAPGREPVDLLVGNPPWLSYRFLPAALRSEFRRMSLDHNLWHGAAVATHQDLSALFVARVVHLHLRPGGRFAFVLPGAVLDRNQYAGFRSGDLGPRGVPLAFAPPWDLRRLRPHFFPISAAVVFGARGERAVPLPAPGQVWSGRLPGSDASWEAIQGAIRRHEPAASGAAAVGPVAAAGPGRSPYHARFRQGATLVPRVLCLVERGEPAEGALVRSQRRRAEKAPWRSLPALEAPVEGRFLYEVYLGEAVLPYRALRGSLAVLPRDEGRPLGPEGARSFAGFGRWWGEAERCWARHRSSDRLTLLGQLDYHGKLSSQFPVCPLRVVYSKAGMHLVAAALRAPRAVVDHTLYWAPVASEQEASYLCAVLNAAATTRVVRPLMAYGKDERHIDKAVWRLPIPAFDPADPTHTALAALAAEAEALAARVPLDPARHFSTARREVRLALAQSEVGRQIEARVAGLLGGP